MAKVGYARVSSVGQSLDVQREKLGGCDKLFEENAAAPPMPAPCSSNAWDMFAKAIS